MGEAKAHDQLKKSKTRKDGKNQDLPWAARKRVIRAEITEEASCCFMSSSRKAPE
jgi:hypothetical protein